MWVEGVCGQGGVVGRTGRGPGMGRSRCTGSLRREGRHKGRGP